MDKSYKKWKANQEAAAKAFKPITIHYTIKTCPDCYGGRPQGNESAWAKGCHDCGVFDSCGDDTEVVNDASMSKKDWADMAKRYKEYMSADAWTKRFGNGQPKLA